ncbi:unnamed protein product [Prorocentrum cordatum]|uniref:Uncharacterized protein n=1 Tax=Prorocentrum cordatum TaxID=2364126 RepID=A0ABN9QQN9_9DINO|nr:unnamed protein product [Polarella glacialis]
MAAAGGRPRPAALAAASPRPAPSPEHAGFGEPSRRPLASWEAREAERHLCRRALLHARLAEAAAALRVARELEASRRPGGQDGGTGRPRSSSGRGRGRSSTPPRGPEGRAGAAAASGTRRAAPRARPGERGPTLKPGGW